MSDSPKGLLFWSLSDVGRVRTHNEDSLLVSPELGLYAVADGMGGHAAGEVASQLALQSVGRVVGEGQGVLLACREAPESREAQRAVARLLERAGRAACEDVYAEAQRDEQKRGMGTTLCVLLVAGRRAFIGHVGDSRMYLLRDGQAHRLTEDHSLRNELLKRGNLSREQIEGLRQKNALTRAVGVYESVDVDTLDLELAPGDRVLICSDGLSGHVRGQELPELLDPPELACRRLVDLANERGGRDNITVVLVGVPDEVGNREDLRLPIEALRQVPLFRYFNYQERVRLGSFAEMRCVVKDEAVFHEGDPGNELFVVLSGSVRVHAGGKEIASLGPGEQFGEMALLDRSPRSANVTALERTRLIVIKREDFFQIMRHERDMAVKLLWHLVGTLTTRLRDTTGALGQARHALDLSAELFDPQSLESKL